MRKTLLEAMRAAAVVALAALSGLHVLWAFGSAWPAADRATLAEAIGGFRDVPAPAACLIVAKLLGLAALCVAGLPRSHPRLTGAGSAVTSATFLLRAAAGYSGALPHARRSATFAALDRRVYAPVCLVVGATAAAGALRS